MSTANQRIAPDYWKKAIVVLAAGWVVIWISRMMLTPIYSVLSDFFGGVSNTELGAISSFYFLGYVVMQIPSGLLVDRFGMRAVAVPGFIVFALGVVAIALSGTLPMLYAGSVVSGAGCGTFYGIAYSITNTYVPGDKKSLATAIVNSGTAVGSGLGLVSASCLVSTGVMPWQALAGSTAVLAALMAFVFSRTLPARTPKAPAGEKDAVASKAEDTGPSSLARLFEPHMVAAYIVYFSTLYMYYLISTWLPNFLATERGFADSFTGIVSSLVFFAGIPGALVFSRVADKLPHRRVQLIVGLQLVAAAILFFMIQSTAKPLIVAGIVAYGFLGKLTVEPITISWLGQFAPAGSVATTFGVFNFFGMCASVVAPSVTGALTDSLGSGVWGFMLAIAVMLAGTLAFVLINLACDARARATQPRRSREAS